MTTPQQSPDAPDQSIDITAAEWLVIIVTGFTGVFAGPLALVPGAVLLGMFAYRVNPELMKASKAGQWVRGLLPAPTYAPELDAPVKASAPTNQPTNVAQHVAPTATAPAGTGVVAPAKTLAMIDLATLARCSTLLLVGSRGSGKSTLLRALLAARTDAIMVYDPHAAPTDWPMATMVHNSEASISTGLASAYKRLQQRKDERRKGIRTEGWPPLTLAADEWGSIVSSVVLPKAIDRTPGEVSTELMKEGRKFGIGFVAGAHGKTNASLGCTGDQEAFIQSFDWIINLGGFTRKMLAREYAELLDQIPMGTNEQGGTFPLIVVCESPTTGELRLLDMRGLHTPTYPATTRPVRTIPWQTAQSDGANALLAELLQPVTRDTEPREESRSDMDVTAAQSDVKGRDTVTGAMPTPTEIAQIATSLSRGMTPSQAAKAMKGCNSRTYQGLLAKVHYVKTLTETDGPGDPTDS